MSANPAHKQLFELWHQSSLSALSVSPQRLGLGDAPHPDVERAFLTQALQSWDRPTGASDQPR